MTIAKHSILMLITVIITLGLNYFFNVALGWVLPVEEYGIYGVSMALIMILTFFVSSTFPLTAAKFISQEKNKTVKLKVFKSALLGNFLLAIAISFIFLIIYFTLLKFEGKYTGIIYLIALCIFITAISECYRGALQGLFKFKELALANIFGTVAKFSGIVLIIIGFGVFGAILGIVVGGIITSLLMISFAKLKFWEVKGFDYRIFSFAPCVFIAMFSLTFIQNIDLIALKILTGLDKIAGFYQAIITIARLPFWIAGAVLTVVFAYLSNTKKVLYSVKTLKYFAIFLLTPSLFMSINPSSFITLIFPEIYLEASECLSILALAIIFLIFNQTFMYIFQAIGKPEIPAKFLGLSLIFQAILLYFLIPKFKLLGAAASTLISMVFCFIVFSYEYLKWTRLKLNFVEISKFIIVSLITLICFAFLSYFTTFYFIFNLIISFAIYFVLLIIFNILNKEDIKIILNALPKVVVK